MIEFKNVSMSYHQNAPLALKNVSFTIEDGEFIFIIGKSGSGKSTIVKLLTCEEKVNSGTVCIGSYSLNRLKKRWVPFLRRNIGMVFQDFRLISTKTIFENVAFALEIQGYSKKAIRRQVSMVLSTVGLRDKEDAFPNELSGGEQQRIAIARAMVNNPAVLLADEPTGNLDPANSEMIMALLEEINRSGTTVVICTHDQHLVDRMKKRVITIHDGQLVGDDIGGQYRANDLRAERQITMLEGKDAVYSEDTVYENPAVITETVIVERTVEPQENLPNLNQDALNQNTSSKDTWTEVDFEKEAITSLPFEEELQTRRTTDKMTEETLKRRNVIEDYFG